MSLSQTQRLPGQRDEPKVLWVSAGVALVLEFVILTVVGWEQNWMPKPTAPGEAVKFIEAQVYQPPKLEHLIEPEKTVAPVKREATLSKVPDKGREAKPDEKQVQDQNQTQGGPILGATHGPVVVFSPSPVIPPYLQNQDLHASVVIDFYVTAQGETTPRLVNSSGNQELDAIAISAAKKWRFKPAEKDHQVIDAKARLRILFEVK